MITIIEALNYRCLRYISRPLDSFHVLVGPNASGKSTFLDVVAFLKEVVSDGLEDALSNRASNPEELLFRRQGDGFELAIEARIPDDIRLQTAREELDSARYEVAIGFDDSQRRFEFKSETFRLKKSGDVERRQRPLLFPMSAIPLPVRCRLPRVRARRRLVISKVPGGNDNFYSEIYASAGQGLGMPSFKLGPHRSALGNLPADENSFPVATWFRELLNTGVQRFVLNSLQIKRPSPPQRVKGFLPDGSNLPWVIAHLREQDPGRYKSWISHLQTALTDLKEITTVERPEDKHCYMVFGYEGGVAVPSWLVSDGTLRLAALTLPAYLNNIRGVYLIEEPENGIHPGAISTVYDSLSSVYGAQVLLATHSTVILNAARASDVLCFAKDEAGSTDIVLGAEHPRLREWRGETSLGALLASGILG